MAAPSCDEQGDPGRFLSGLQREGWGGGGQSERSGSCPVMRTPGSYLSYNPHLRFTSLGVLVEATHHGLGRRGRRLH